jgi:ATP phosphoribosyltransferase regulatory subunit HisZ
VKFCFDVGRSSGIGYYSGLCYRITANNASGKNYSLAGGGACDWTRKLLNNKREHLIASGFGTEFFNKMFRSD